MRRADQGIKERKTHRNRNRDREAAAAKKLRMVTREGAPVRRSQSALKAKSLVILVAN